MASIINLFGKNKKDKKYTIARKVIQRIKEKLDYIKALYESTQLRKEISNQLQIESADYDGLIIKVQTLLLSILQKTFKSKQEEKTLEQWILEPLSNAKIGTNYDLKTDIYNEKIKHLDIVLERLNELEKGNAPKNTKELKEYKKAA